MEDTNYAELVNELKDKREGDNICADCKNEDPRWASYNLGIFVCLRCSGIHRSLGTHISRVKSLDLDTWTYEQYKHMEDIGNVKANRYWEAKLDPDFEPPERYINSIINRMFIKS
ncbi:Arf GTPase activating protein [Neoconidiobolus thromboides FSU 785]|nr:Arf GTPase activating protein [Neoconidiobolus thromboides FSU 785]